MKMKIVVVVVQNKTVMQGMTSQIPSLALSSIHEVTCKGSRLCSNEYTADVVVKSQEEPVIWNMNQSKYDKCLPNESADPAL